MFKTLVVIVLSTILLILNLLVMIEILIELDDNFKTGALIGIKEFICELFYNRNIFGILLSLVILVLVIPAIVLILMTQIIIWICGVLLYIYNLGIKKSSKN